MGLDACSPRVWPSGWVRTFFFNPTRPDGQISKPSPRVRTPELVQGSGRQDLTTQTNPSDRTQCPDPTRNPKTAVQPVGWAPNPNIGPYNKLGLGVRADKNPCPIQPVGRNALSDSTRRTKIRTRPTRSAKSACPVQPVGLRHCVQPCPTLGLDARARVQPNPTVTLFTLVPFHWNIWRWMLDHSRFIHWNI
jgi:hypothetical protein